MQPYERFKKLNTEGNLWIYILILGKERVACEKECEICDENVGRLIFEKFGFLPNNLLVKSVLYRLRREGFINTDKFKGKRSFIITEKGLKELEKIKDFYQELLQKT